MKNFNVNDNLFFEFYEQLYEIIRQNEIIQRRFRTLTTIFFNFY